MKFHGTGACTARYDDEPADLAGWARTRILGCAINHPRNPVLRMGNVIRSSDLSVVCAPPDDCTDNSKDAVRGFLLALSRDFTATNRKMCAGARGGLDICTQVRGLIAAYNRPYRGGWQPPKLITLFLNETAVNIHA